MIGNQFILGIAAELVIDLFAGGGGASTGIEQAIGRHVDIAVNHDAKAVSLHEANHPQTRHFVADVFEVDPLTVTDGQPVGLLWASPDCKHFSKAKGGKPVSKKIRGLAWVVVDWARAVRPRVICLENVEEFKTWGPLIDDNMPDPARRGETFEEWKGQLEALGYVVEHRELRACDYGAPTIRYPMREIGIQYSAPMVRAVLDGSKSVTRRTAKGEIPANVQTVTVDPEGRWRWFSVDAAGTRISKPFRCPYGVLGDRLWVREAWRTTGCGGRADDMPPRDLQPHPVWYVADGTAPVDECCGKVRPGMFMPRWASRILLEVTGVTCERLQDITDEQSLAEGVLPDEASHWGARDSYSALWDSLNGEGAWTLNPWVFAISFRRITP